MSLQIEETGPIHFLTSMSYVCGVGWPDEPKCVVAWGGLASLGTRRRGAVYERVELECWRQLIQAQAVTVAAAAQG
jgi:hypothetical protein